jgi:hypothetical protein
MVKTNMFLKSVQVRGTLSAGPLGGVVRDPRSFNASEPVCKGRRRETILPFFGIELEYPVPSQPPYSSLISARRCLKLRLYIVISEE